MKQGLNNQNIKQLQWVRFLKMKEDQGLEEIHLRMRDFNRLYACINNIDRLE
jgi:hypothetical protein